MLLTLLLAWCIAAVLHLAIGSISVAAITAAGIIGPILAELGLSADEVAALVADGVV